MTTPPQSPGAPSSSGPPSGSSGAPTAASETFGIGGICRRIPTSVMALAIVLLCAFLTAASTLLITVVFSLEGVRAVAALTASQAFARYEAHVSNTLAIPRDFADTLQFTVKARSFPDPVDMTLPGFNVSNQTWHSPWISMSMAASRYSDFNFQHAAVTFANGQYTGCQNNAYDETIITCVYSAPSTPGNASSTFIVTNYSRTDGAFVATYVNTQRYNATARPWYINTKKEPDAELWSDVTLSAFPTAPVVTYSRTVFNTRGMYLGIAFFNVNLGSIGDKFKSMMADVTAAAYTAKAFLLDNRRRVIATSTPHQPFAISSITADYVLSPEDTANGCTRTTPGVGFAPYMVCQRDAFTLGDQDLSHLVAQRPDMFVTSQTGPTSDIGEGTSGSRYFVRVAPLSGLGSLQQNNMDWRLVVMLKESDVIGPVIKGRNIAIGVCVAVFVMFAIIVGVGLHLLLRPLGAVARSMLSSSFLAAKETGSDAAAASTTSSADTPLDDPTTQRLSYLSEVATIQQSYWAMVQELRLLKAYIPEHIRNEVLASKRRGGGRKEAARRPSSTSSRDGPGFTAIISPSPIGDGDDDACFSEADGGEEMGKCGDVLTAQHLHAHVEATAAAAHPTGGSDTPPQPVANLVSDWQVALPEPSAQQVRLPTLHTHSLADRVPTHRTSVAYSAQHFELESRIHSPLDTEEPPVFFGDNVLVDRDISVAVVNIVQFHKYAQRHHGTDITREHAEVVRFVHTTARRCGGILETFLGDRFIVSFNATSKCQHHAVAATCFALEVATVVNRDAVEAMRPSAGAGGARHKPRFRIAPCGVTCGVATGRAFVGPLGTELIRRHTIISNAVPEAVALERMVIRYPNCGVMIGGDMLPAVEGYFQYILVDATLLPGSDGKRRRIASVKAGMCREGLNPRALRGLSDLPAARERRTSPYASINASFNAFLEGRRDDCVSALVEAKTAIEMSAQGIALPDKQLTHEQSIDVGIMCELVLSFGTTTSPYDGRSYRSNAGDAYQPCPDRSIYMSL